MPSLSFAEHFASLPDPRVERTRRHALIDILTIALCAVICGADGFVEMEAWGRAREPWLEGRLIVTPHSAFWTPEAARDIRVKSAETMRAALLTDRPQNVITPEMD